MRKLIGIITSLILGTGLLVGAGMTASATTPPPEGPNPPPGQCVVDTIEHPAVEEVSHKEWRFQTRTPLYGSKEVKDILGWDFVDGGTTWVNGQTVAGHWVQSDGWHTIPEVIINIVWGPSGVPDQYLGTGSVNLSSYGGPNKTVQYDAHEVQTDEGWTAWGPWSDWSTTNPGPSNETRNVEKRKVVTQHAKDAWTDYVYGDCPTATLPLPQVTQTTYVCEDGVPVRTEGGVTFPEAPEGTEWREPAGDNVTLPAAPGASTGVFLDATGDYVFDTESTVPGWLVLSKVAYFTFSFDEEPVAPDCVTTIPAPPAPVWQDPCGPDNGTWVYTDTEEYTYQVTSYSNGKVKIVATPADGFAFPEGTKTQWQKFDSGEECPPEIPEQPEPESEVVSTTKAYCDGKALDTITTTTTDYVLVGDEWVPGEPVVTTETVSRDATAEEIESLDCPLPTPDPEPEERELASTGTDSAFGGLLFAGGAFLLAALLIGARTVYDRRKRVQE